MGLWQAGATPWTSEGDSITLNFSDPEAVKFANYWTDLLERDLVADATHPHLRITFP